MRRVVPLLIAAGLLAGCGADAGSELSDAMTPGSLDISTSEVDAPDVEGVAVTYSTYGGCETADQCVTDVTLDAAALGADLVAGLETADLAAIGEAGSGTCASVTSDGVGFRATITLTDGSSTTVECLNEIDGEVDPVVDPLVTAVQDHATSG